MRSTAKRIFISDIHMGIHPYAWLGCGHARMLADFLQKKVIEDSEVKELVILGDLFDQWVYPARLDPPSTATDYFKMILEEDHNKGVIENLQKIAKDGRLTYVPGNHDMLVDLDLDEDKCKTLIMECFKGINYEGTDVGEGVFDEEGIVAEHGSMYCLFNAPDPYSNSPSKDSYKLPLGYFITRVVTDSDFEYLDVLKDAIEEIIHDILKGKKIKPAEVVFDSICRTCSVQQIEMDTFDGYSGLVTVNDIDKWYGDLYSEWDNHEVIVQVTNASGYEEVEKKPWRHKTRISQILNTSGYEIEFQNLDHPDDNKLIKQNTVSHVGGVRGAVIPKADKEKDWQSSRIQIVWDNQTKYCIWQHKDKDGDHIRYSKGDVYKEPGDRIPGNSSVAGIIDFLPYRQLQVSSNGIELRNTFPALLAILSDLLGLDLAAQSKHKCLTGRPIVIFGHTHEAVIRKGDMEIWKAMTDKLETHRLRESFLDSLPEPTNYMMEGKEDFIYANCGTWIDGKDCTFVETEVEDGKHHVRIKQYKPDGTIHCLGEQYIDL